MIAEGTHRLPRRLDKPELVSVTAEADWCAAGKILLIVRPELNLENFVADRSRLSEGGYKLLGVKLRDSLVSVASYVIVPHVQYYNELQIREMATVERCRSHGFGSLLLKEIDKIAAENSCGRCFVHSRIEREGAHNFYKKHGYQHISSAFIKKVKPGPATLNGLIAPRITPA